MIPFSGRRSGTGVRSPESGVRGAGVPREPRSWSLYCVLVLRTSVFSLSLIPGFFLPGPARAAVNPNKMELDRIEIAGVTVFANSDVEATIEISPGDRLERVKVVRTAENLQSLYRVHGYEQVTIKPRFNRKKTEAGAIETILEFDVTEGAPTRIAEIEFVPESIRDEAFLRYWDRLEVDLATRISVAAGAIFDQEKIGSADGTCRTCSRPRSSSARRSTTCASWPPRPRRRRRRASKARRPAPAS